MTVNALPDVIKQLYSDCSAYKYGVGDRKHFRTYLVSSRPLFVTQKGEEIRLRAASLDSFALKFVWTNAKASKRDIQAEKRASKQASIRQYKEPPLFPRKMHLSADNPCI